MEVGARSETGYVRSENQDRMSGTSVPLGRLFIVADGMGGHRGGALAAQLVVQGLQQHLELAAELPVEEAIKKAFQAANDTVYRQAHAGDPAVEGMGSTAVVLLVCGSSARVAHVGDSRAYLYRNGVLKQLTRDHTVVQRMVDAGMLKPEEAAGHPDSNLLVRAMGNRPEVDVDISTELPVEEGDAFLLCSDGLSTYVAREAIENVLRGSASAQEVADALVELALESGGPDNITVQFIRFGSAAASDVESTRVM